jgi:hypothetical protein
MSDGASFEAPTGLRPAVAPQSLIRNEYNQINSPIVTPAKAGGQEPTHVVSMF